MVGKRAFIITWRQTVNPLGIWRKQGETLTGRSEKAIRDQVWYWAHPASKCCKTIKKRGGAVKVDVAKIA